ncbi:hypothetical protein ACFSM5_13175 [Lacibacterium aquatile]|uniref:PAS domain-containing protein n=1 Tax=Lacibacterium aquatile TaxID=1168082 RepID=A0ABW5DRY2_9PROT
MLPSDDWHDEAVELAGFLRQAAGDRAYASRRDLRPERLSPGLLASLYMVDVTSDASMGGGPWRYRFRLIGDELISMTGENWTGRNLDSALVGPRLPMFLSAFDEVMQTRKPTRTTHDFINMRANVAYPAVRYLFPLSSDGETIDVMLGYIVALSRHWIEDDTAGERIAAFGRA